MCSWWHCRTLWRALGFACAGCYYGIRHERALAQTLLATLVAVVLLCVFGHSRLFIWLGIQAWILTWVVEWLNTAIEKTLDRITTAYDERIKIAKDISAAAVLVSWVWALLVSTMAVWA